MTQTPASKKRMNAAVATENQSSLPVQILINQNNLHFTHLSICFVKGKNLNWTRRSDYQINQTMQSNKQKKEKLNNSLGCRCVR